MNPILKKAAREEIAEKGSDVAKQYAAHLEKSVEELSNALEQQKLLYDSNFYLLRSFLEAQGGGKNVADLNVPTITKFVNGDPVRFLVVKEAGPFDEETGFPLELELAVLDYQKGTNEILKFAPEKEDVDKSDDVFKVVDRAGEAVTENGQILVFDSPDRAWSHLVHRLAASKKEIQSSFGFRIVAVPRTSYPLATDSVEVEALKRRQEYDAPEGQDPNRDPNFRE